MTVTDVSTTCAEVTFRVKVISYRQWVVFMSLLIGAFRSSYCSGQSVVREVVITSVLDEDPPCLVVGALNKTPPI